ncbi:MAG: hypothetical protein ACRDSS_04920, partial [Actinocrinis sp.]
SARRVRSGADGDKPLTRAGNGTGGSNGNGSNGAVSKGAASNGAGSAAQKAKAADGSDVASRSAEQRAAPVR